MSRLRWLLAQVRRLFRRSQTEQTTPVRLPPFPPTLLRGLRSGKVKKGTNEIKADAFDPSEKSLEARRRDGFEPAGHDVSINWEDDSGALPLLQADGKNAEGGVARLKHDAATALFAIPEFKDKIVCERRAIRGNTYHGNIVFLEGLEKHVRLRACAHLALEAEFIAPPVAT